MSVAQSIEWHEECLKNVRSSAEEKRRLANAYADDADRLEKYVLMYSQQIERAKAEGKDRFDRDRYLKGKLK